MLGWNKLKMPKTAILEKKKIYSLNVSLMTFVKHMEWKLTTIALHVEKKSQSYATKILSLNSYISKSTIWVLKTFYHPQANSFDMIWQAYCTNYYNLANTWQPWMLQPLRLSVKILIVLLQKLEWKIIELLIRIWNRSHNWNLPQTYLKHLIFQTIF